MKKTFTFIALLGCLLAGSVQAAAPKGWFITGSAPADYDIGSAPGSRRSGDMNGFIRAKTNSSGFGTLMQTINASNYRSKRVRFSGFLRTKDASKAQLWMRIDGTDKHILGFDNMEQRALRGDNEWQHYSIVLDVPTEAADIAFGFLLSGRGEVWGDSFQLETVGNEIPLTGTPHPQLPDTPVNLDFAQ